MRVKLQLVMCTDDGQKETVTDIVTLQKDSQRIEHLGLTLREAKQLLTTIQKHLLQHQVAAFLAACSTCPSCGTLLKAKGYHTAVLAELDHMRQRGATPDEVADACPPEFLTHVGYYGTPEGAAAAFQHLAEGLDVALVRVVAARPGIASVLTTLHACRPTLVNPL